MSIANSKIRIYACGGAGINIASPFKNERFDVVYVDSSDSNLKKVGEGAKTFLIKGMDGAGKLRRSTYVGFKDKVEACLIENPPSTHLNIVLSSISGGTGSVTAPQITADLIEKGFPTIVIAVATKGSVIEVKNGINTIHTYANISKKLNSVVSVLYCDASRQRKDTDAHIIDFLNLIALITDRSKTDGADTADLHNWINFNKVTDIEPCLSLLSPILNNGEEYEGETAEQGVVASTLLVTKDPEEGVKGVFPEYHAEILITSETDLKESFRIDNIVGLLPHMISQLEDLLARSQDALKTATIAEVESKESDEDDGFFVL